MKKIHHALILAFGLLSSSFSFGQLPNGSIAPNFTLTDINGNSHTLYDYLDAGKTVYIDFFACHCPFCWNYHNSNALSNLYDQYGPNTPTDDVFVFAIEYDPNNGNNEFYGISGYTQGNWVAGTNYPQINPEGAARTSIIANYAVNYYPLIYAICPDRTITVIGTKNTAQLYAHTSTCSTSLGIDEAEKLFAVTQYETTLSIQSTMDFSNSKASLVLTDIQGKQLVKTAFSENSKTVDLNGISKGIYFIQIESENQILFSQKVQI